MINNKKRELDELPFVFYGIDLFDLILFKFVT